MKRIGLFLLTNIAVILVLSVVAHLFGLNQYLEADGTLNLTTLLLFCAIFGMGGSFISLLMSKWVALKMTGAQIIENPRSSQEMWLVNTVKRQAQAAGIGTPIAVAMGFGGMKGSNVMFAVEFAR